MHLQLPWELFWNNQEKEALTTQLPLQAESYPQQKETIQQREGLAMVYALLKF